MKPSIALLVLTALLPALAAAESPDIDAPLITVTGQGVVRIEPDQAMLRIGIETQRPTAAEAQHEANRVAAAVLAQMLEIGVAEHGVQTSALTLRPVYTQRRPNQDDFAPKIVGYRADNTVQVTLDDLDLTGPAVDRAIAAGANQIQNLNFGLRDDSAAQQAAIRAAVGRAAAKASAVAEALGRELDTVVEVREGGVSVRPVVGARRYAAEAAPAATPVAVGQVTVSATVTVVYSLVD